MVRGRVGMESSVSHPRSVPAASRARVKVNEVVRVMSGLLRSSGGLLCLGGRALASWWGNSCGGGGRQWGEGHAMVGEAYEEEDCAHDHEAQDAEHHGGAGGVDDEDLEEGEAEENQAGPADMGDSGAE